MAAAAAGSVSLLLRHPVILFPFPDFSVPISDAIFPHLHKGVKMRFRANMDIAGAADPS